MTFIQKTALDVVVGDMVVHPTTVEHVKVTGVHENITAREPELVISFERGYKIRTKPGAIFTVIC
jgi:hypothetical protein